MLKTNEKNTTQTRQTRTTGYSPQNTVKTQRFDTQINDRQVNRVMDEQAQRQLGRQIEGEKKEGREGGMGEKREEEKEKKERGKKQESKERSELIEWFGKKTE